jgi:hypothetical protein
LWWLEVHNEIPICEVITAIKSADSEDYIAQLLFSQGWPILYRAIAFDGVMQFLEAGELGPRTVLLYTSDLPGLDRERIAAMHNEELIWICMDGLTMNSHAIMVYIRNQVREPIYQRPPRVDDEVRKTVTVSGTPGAPGRSAVALALSHCIADALTESQVEIIDADLQAPSQSYYFSAQARPNNLTLVSIDRSMRPQEISLHAPFSIVDTGALQSLRDLMTDRRWQGGLLNSLIEKSDELIYVVGVNPLGLMHLEAFIRDSPVITSGLNISFLLNQLGNSRMDRSVHEKFSAIVEGRPAFTLQKGSLGAFEKGKNPYREIATIAAELGLVEGQPWARSTTSSRPRRL